jgi:hypothetical protein
MMLEASSEASIELGTIKSGEDREFQLSSKDAFVPFSRDLPPRAQHLFGELQIRIVYNLQTPEGHLWAEVIGIKPDSPE